MIIWSLARQKANCYNICGFLTYNRFVSLNTSKYNLFTNIGIRHSCFGKIVLKHKHVRLLSTAMSE